MVDDGILAQDRVETALGMMRWGLALSLTGLIGSEVLGHIKKGR